MTHALPITDDFELDDPCARPIPAGLAPIKALGDTAVAPAPGARLEPAAQAFADLTAKSPSLFELGPDEAQIALEQLQAGAVDKPDVEATYETIPGAPQLSPASRRTRGWSQSGNGSILVLRPPGGEDPLPAIVYMHGGGWVLGDYRTHDRLARELAVGSGAAVIFVNYLRSPGVHYPTAVEEGYAALEWVAEQAPSAGLDGSRIAVAGDDVGGNMAGALALMAKERSGPPLAAQVLFYPVLDASCETPSYHQFAEGYYLRREGMLWCWDQYLRDPSQREEVTVSPLRASLDQLAGLPPALVITAEADVVRDEGEAYAAKLRQAGVAVTATRYEGVIHDFVMLNALRETHAARAAISQATSFLKAALAS